MDSSHKSSETFSLKRPSEEPNSVSKRQHCVSETSTVTVEATMSDPEVTIILSVEPRITFNLHRSTLVRYSPWFQKELIEENEIGLRIDTWENLRFIFKLETDPPKMVPLLQPKRVKSFDKDHHRVTLLSSPLSPSDQVFSQPSSVVATDLGSEAPNDPDSPHPVMKTEPVIKTEPAGSTSAEISAWADVLVFSDQRAITAYTLLFDVYRGTPLRVEAENIEAAFGVCLRLAMLADTYGSLPAVRPHMKDLLFEHGQHLFSAVAADPPGWLLLAIYLESKPIFSEAMIHLCGTHPAWPWRSPREMLAKHVHDMIESKARALSTLVSETIMKVLTNTVYLENPNRPCSYSDGFETWLVVQIFRDHVLGWIRRISKPSCAAGAKKEATPVKSELKGRLDPLQIGHIFRHLQRGGDSYLQLAQVIKRLKDPGAQNDLKSVPTEWDEVAEDLGLMKNFAQSAVREVCTNRLMLGLEGTKIGYLTCVEIKPEDFPWLGSAGTAGINHDAD